jgi:hypothetical protein
MVDQYVRGQHSRLSGSHLRTGKQSGYFPANRLLPDSWAGEPPLSSIRTAPADPLLVGSAQLAPISTVSGFAVFQQTVGSSVQEAVVPWRLALRARLCLHSTIPAGLLQVSPLPMCLPKRPRSL